MIVPKLNHTLVAAALTLCGAWSADRAVAQGVPPAPPYMQGYWEAPFNHQKSMTSPPQSFAVGEPLIPTGCTFDPLPPPPMFGARPLGDNGVQAGGVYLSLHMSLIPRGEHQGKLLVWSHEHYPTTNPAGESRALYWAIVDPETQTCENFMWCQPEGRGDLFCAGHSWNATGNLVVAGGTMHHGTIGGGGLNGWTGSVLTYVYDTSKVYTAPVTAATNPWLRTADMQMPRWYPSVTVLGGNGQLRNGLMVAGGSNNSLAVNSYQVWDETLGQGAPWGDYWTDPTLGRDLFYGPNSGASNPWPFGFTDYPRAHLLSTGHVMTAGMPPGSDRVNHYVAPEIWLADPTWIQRSTAGASIPRVYGSSVLLPVRISPPNYDNVLAVGGANAATVHTSVMRSFGSGNAAQRAWTSTASLTQRRMFLNTVVLPDGSVLAVGGRKNNSTGTGLPDQAYGCTYEAAYVPELYEGGQWKQMAEMQIIRDYHSVALLLPNGNVMVGGGESREWQQAASNCIEQSGTTWPNDKFHRNAISSPSDYQVFVPPCAEFALARRPQVTNMAAPGQAIQKQRGDSLALQYQGMPLDETVSKVVLTWPGSVTHHADANQRCVELTIQSLVEPFPQNGTGTVTAQIPTNAYLVPSGYYMAFLVTSEGAVSQRAAWVQVL